MFPAKYLLIIAICTPLYAQVDNKVPTPSATDPTGKTCKVTSATALLQWGGIVYSCQGTIGATGAYAILPGSGGSSGGITGPGTTTVGFIPTWDSSTGASVGAGLGPTGSGSKLVSAVAAGTSGNCGQWLTSNLGDSGSPCPSTGTEIISFSPTPTFSATLAYSSILLTGNVTSFTLANGATGGVHKTIDFCQDATGGRTVVKPSNVRGFSLATTSPNTCYSYSAHWNTSVTAWLADQVVNQ